MKEVDRKFQFTDAVKQRSGLRPELTRIVILNETTCFNGLRSPERDEVFQPFIRS